MITVNTQQDWHNIVLITETHKWGLQMDLAVIKLHNNLWGNIYSNFLYVAGALAN